MSKKEKTKGRRGTRKGAGNRPQPPVLQRGVLWASLLVAVVGGGLALYATNLTFTIARQGLMDPSGCSINEWINCDVAHASSYALLLGVPVAWWGFLFYLGVALAVGYALRTQNRDGAAGALAVMWLLSLGAVLFSVLKAYHLMQLNVLCLICLGMYAANIGLALLLPAALRLSWKARGQFLGHYVKGLAGRDTPLNFSPRPRRYGLLLLALFGFGFIGIKGYEGDTLRQPDLDLDRVLDAHFRQSPRAVTVNPETPVWGNPEAPVTVVEFADFQCPACRESAFHLRGALFEFRDKVRFYFMNFPLQQHRMAASAAAAGVCAARMGDFWGYHDDLFRNQVSLGRTLYLSLAENHGWDQQAFAACMDSDTTRARVEADRQEGMNVQVPSTPTILINGRRVSYWKNTDFIRAVIREELKRGE